MMNYFKLKSMPFRNLYFPSTLKLQVSDIKHKGTQQAAQVTQWVSIIAADGLLTKGAIVHCIPLVLMKNFGLNIRRVNT